MVIQTYLKDNVTHVRWIFHPGYRFRCLVNRVSLDFDHISIWFELASVNSSPIWVGAENYYWFFLPVVGAIAAAGIAAAACSAVAATDAAVHVVAAALCADGAAADAAACVAVGAASDIIANTAASSAAVAAAGFAFNAVILSIVVRIV